MLEECGLLYDPEAGGYTMEMGQTFTVKQPDGQVKPVNVKIQFTTEGAIIPMTVYENGIPVATYSIKIENGQLTLNQSTPAYNMVLATLADKTIGMDQRIILEQVTPTMTAEEIAAISERLKAEGRIAADYTVTVTEEGIEITKQE